MTDTDTATRTAYTEGLRQLADILDNHPDLPLPYHGTEYSALNWIETSDDGGSDLASARLFARLIPGTITKNPRGAWFDLDGYIAGLKVCFITTREAVCTRIVTGTREVTVPAEPARPAEPERVEQIEDVEWVCGSLLADDVALADAS